MTTKPREHAEYPKMLYKLGGKDIQIGEDWFATKVVASAEEHRRAKGWHDLGRATNGPLDLRKLWGKVPLRVRQSKWLMKGVLGAISSIWVALITKAIQAFW